MAIHRHFRVAPSIYETAEELVTKCLRSTRKQQFPTCFPLFSLACPHVSHSFPHVYLGIFHFSPSVSPCFLF